MWGYMRVDHAGPPRLRRQSWSLHPGRQRAQHARIAGEGDTAVVAPGPCESVGAFLFHNLTLCFFGPHKSCWPHRFCLDSRKSFRVVKADCGETSFRGLCRCGTKSMPSKQNYLSNMYSCECALGWYLALCYTALIFAPCLIALEKHT